MSKILVSPQAAFIPIIKELYPNHSIITLTPDFCKTLRDLDLPKVTALSEHITPHVHSTALKQSAYTISELHKPLNLNGLSGQALIWMREQLPAYAYSKVADIVLFLESIHTVSPDLVLAHNDVEPLTRAAALWCRANDRPCIHIPHANYQDVENDGFDIHAIVSATHVLSSGPYQSHWYESRANGVEFKIIETGLPQFDNWARLSLNPQRCRQSLQLELHKPVITYASSWRQNTNLLGMHDGVEETYTAILEVAKKMTDIQFVIKCHPRGNNIQYHVELAQKMNVKNILITAHHLEQVLQSSDLLFAYGPSNILLEASHIPWLRLACTSGYEGDNGIAKINTDPPNVDHIETCLYEVLNNNPVDLHDFRKKYLGLCDGLNYLRATRVIEAVINNGTSKHFDHNEPAITEAIQEIPI